jgi:hypothetical protein
MLDGAEGNKNDKFHPLAHIPGYCMITSELQ